MSLSLGQVSQLRGACASTFSFLFPVSPVERGESRILLVLGQGTDSGLQMTSGLQKDTVLMVLGIRYDMSLTRCIVMYV